MQYNPNIKDGLIFGILFGFILQFFYQKSLEQAKAQAELKVTRYLDNEFLADLKGTDF